MPIKDLQQQQAQVGRIRLGQQVPTGRNGKTRPEKLDRFRFTTPSQQLANAVAARYGGEVVQWATEGRAAEWEVVSEARVLPVLVPPRPVTQWYELWSGAGCQRRCDGETEQISGDPCVCPLDQLERADLAGQGKACKATTRLKVMLPEVPGMGVWRLDTHGFYAAIELPQTADFLGAVTAANGYIKANLALEERVVKRPGVGVRHFLVPALHVDATPLELMAGGGVVAVNGVTETLAIEGDGPKAIEAAPAKRTVDDFKALVDSAVSEDELLALHRQAEAEGVWGPTLKAYFAARKTAVTSATPAADGPTFEQALADLLMAAAEQPEDFDVIKAFEAKYGHHTDAATPAELVEFRESLRTAVPA